MELAKNSVFNLWKKDNLMHCMDLSIFIVYNNKNVLQKGEA